MKSINIQFPLRDDTARNNFYLMNQITKDAFSSDLLFLLLTEKGERYYNPDFGTNLLKFIFNPNDNLTEASVEQEIKQTVSLYLPNLKIDKITFNRLVDDQGNKISETELNVNIKFTYTEGAFSDAGELDLNF
jgi:phage baseplate assembly protein W